MMSLDRIPATACRESLLYYVVLSGRLLQRRSGGSRVRSANGNIPALQAVS
jgi:hypothetical protein